MNESYSVKDIIILMLNHIWQIIAVAVLGAVVGFCVSKFLLPLEYSSHITMYVQSYTGISESADNVNNISNSKQLVNTYKEVLKDDAVMNAVGEQLLEQYPADLLAENFTLTGSGVYADPRTAPARGANRALPDIEPHLAGAKPHLKQEPVRINQQAPFRYISHELIQISG